MIEQVTERLSTLMDVTATKDWANCTARADVVVDGDVLLGNYAVGMWRARIAGTVMSACLVGCAGRPEAALDERPAPTAALVDLAAEPDDAKACGSCHTAIADQWAGSQHATAWSDPVFQSGYAVDREPECRACHAPLAEGDRDPTPESVAAKRGISCRVCHARSGAIMGPPGARMHGGPVDERWGTSEGCRSCHQFNFAPDTPSRRAVFDPGEWMQRTYEEWEASGSVRTCQDCHMPWETDSRGQRYRSHRMLGIADVEAMTRAVEVMVRAELRGEVVVATTEVAVDARQLAHAFPTGDMFRTARLEVWPVEDPAAVQTVLMRREFGSVVRPDADGRTRLWVAEVGDTRPRPGHPVRRILRWGRTSTALVWRLSHLRMDTPRARRQGVDVSINERVVARGQVAVSSTAR